MCTWTPVTLESNASIVIPEFRTASVEFSACCQSELSAAMITIVFKSRLALKQH